MADKRKVLVILSNRLDRQQKPKHFELVSKPDGSVISEKALRTVPREPVYDEVWINEEGKGCIDDCTSMKRIYRHALEKKKG
jgi:hypothetical protein